MRPVILIPARLVSTRFPEKMLHKLDGVPLIKRVYDACEDMDIPTYVLTDSMKVAQASGAAALLTPECESGTDRCCYWANTNALATKYDVAVNVQGDLPDIRKEHVEAVLEGLTTDRVSTLYADIDDMLEEKLQIFDKTDGANAISNYVGAGGGGGALAAGSNGGPGGTGNPDLYPEYLERMGINE